MKRKARGTVRGTYVNAPELLDTVEADDLLQELIPVLLAGRRLREPQGPSILQGVLDVEVCWVIEDGDDLLGVVCAVGSAVSIVGAIRGDGNGVKRDRIGGYILRGRRSWTCGCCQVGGHDCGCVEVW
jgi:hypothetical protein